MKIQKLLTIASSCFLVSLMASCTDPVNQTPPPPDDLQVPSHLISVNQSIAMKNEYETKVAPFIRDSKREKEYEPTQFAYIELDSLKRYIEFLEQVEKLNDRKISGVRIYFAAYPEKGNNDFKIKHPGRETFFIAPTMEQSGISKLSDHQKEYSYLRNVPFAITPKSKKNKFVGEFKQIDGLLFPNDVNVKVEQASLLQSGANSGTGLENTSLILNELYLCPPPTKK